MLITYVSYHFWKQNEVPEKHFNQMKTSRSTQFTLKYAEVSIFYLIRIGEYWIRETIKNKSIFSN